MPFRFRTSLALAGAASCMAVAAALAEPSASDQEACTPDVFRLCSAAIPGEDAIVACLNSKVAQLSPQCRAVIDPPHAPSKRGRRRR